MARPKNRQTSLYFDYPHYAFKRPPEMEGKQNRYPAVIVGAGPVGVTAALELSRHGVASVVLDDKDTVNDGSRAICVARHSFEILQQLGLSDRFTAKALPWTHGTSFYKNQPVFRLEMPHSEQERFHPMYNIQQQYIEKFLNDKAIADDRIDLRWQSRLVGITQDDDAVHLTVATPEGEYGLDADYVLAADGARSAVRHLQNLKLNGDAYEGRYVIVDVQMESDYPTERRAFFDPPSNPSLTVLVHRQPDDIWRIDYQLAEGEDERDAVREETIRAKITSIVAMLGETGDWELEWWSVYKAYTLALDDYRHGRILFIGDAALSLALDDPFTQPLINPRQSVPYTYTDSPLTSFNDRDTEFDGGPGAGAPLVNRKLDGGGYLLDLLGPGFSGLFFTAEAVLSEEIKALFAALQVGDEAFTPIIVSKGSMRANGITVVTDPAGHIAAAWHAVEATFYLTRPDRHICARWKKIFPAEVKQAFTQALGG